MVDKELKLNRKIKKLEEVIKLLKLQKKIDDLEAQLATLKNSRFLRWGGWEGIKR